MNDNEQKKRIIRARLIRLPIFLGIVFLFAWMFRWDIGNTVIEVGSTTTPAKMVPKAGLERLIISITYVDI